MPLKFLPYNQSRQSHTYTHVNSSLLTYLIQATVMAYTVSSNMHTSNGFPPYLTCSLSVTHRPSPPPPSRTSCPPRHRLHSAPLSTVVWALIAGEKKKVKTDTDQCTHHSNQRTQWMHHHSRAAPSPARWGSTQTGYQEVVPWEPLSYISCSFSFSLSAVCDSFSLPLSVYLFRWHALWRWGQISTHAHSCFSSFPP